MNQTQPAPPPVPDLHPDIYGEYLVYCRTCQRTQVVEGDVKASIIAGLHSRLVPICTRPDVADPMPLDWVDQSCPCGTVPCDCD